MENNKIIIILLVIIIILLAGILAAVPNFIKKDDVEVSDERVAQEITNNSDVPDSLWNHWFILFDAGLLDLHFIGSGLRYSVYRFQLHQRSWRYYYQLYPQPQL